MRKNEIFYQLINRENNRELLKELPHLPYLNLALVFYCPVNEGGKRYYAYLTRDGQRKLGLTLEELEELAQENTQTRLPARLYPLDELLRSYLEARDGGIRPRKGGMPMYVLTNERKLFGAACIRYPGMLKRIAEDFATDFYVLPSSIHECILVPSDAGFTPKELQSLVGEVNRTEVPLEEILSDFIYFYSKNGDSLMVCRD